MNFTKPKRKQQSKKWRLADFLIIQDNDSLNWWRWAEMEVGGKRGLHRTYGRAWIEDNILILSPWKVDDFEDGRSYDDIEKEFVSVPYWNRTPYFVKCVDFGPTVLLNCRTLKRVPERIEAEIMPKLGFICEDEAELK